jgi:hypothetical protein
MDLSGGKLYRLRAVIVGLNKGKGEADDIEGAGFRRGAEEIIKARDASKVRLVETDVALFG